MGDWKYDEVMGGNTYVGAILDDQRVVCEQVMVGINVNNPGEKVEQSQKELKEIVAQRNKMDRMQREARVVIRLLELGNQRMLADDGPCGCCNAVEALNLQEFGRLYQACKAVVEEAGKDDEMEWTNEAPKEKGWYWFKATGPFFESRDGPAPKMASLDIPIVVLVGQDEEGLCVAFPQGVWDVENIPGLWSCYMPEPRSGKDERETPQDCEGEIG